MCTAYGFNFLFVCVFTILCEGRIFKKTRHHESLNAVLARKRFASLPRVERARAGAASARTQLSSAPKHAPGVRPYGFKVKVNIFTLCVIL